jgi:CheY-like chemotaxis protein
MRAENGQTADVRSVLIVDNDRDITEVVRALLQDEGYQVSTLSDLSPDAVAATVGRLEPDAILLDGESELAGFGRSWEQAARLAERARPIPVVMFSAHHRDLNEAREGQSERSRRAKLAGVVGKPFDVEDLLDVIATAVGGTASFDRSLAADAARSGGLAKELERVGAEEVQASARREWVTFRTPAGRMMQIYWWQSGGAYLVGRYDDDGRHLENIALTYDRGSAVDICAAVLRAEQLPD